jgi:hypothetical protein
MFFGKKKTKKLSKKDKKKQSELLTDLEKNNPSDKDGKLQKDYEKPRPKGIFRFFKVRYWQRFFNVTTKEIMRRVLLAMMPFTSTPIFPTGKPDLYGPFWIYVTLWVLIAVWGHFSSYIDFIYLEKHGDDDVHEAELEKVGKAWSMMTFYVFIIPLIIHGLFFWFGSGSPGYQRVIGVYGYSFTIFIPAVILLMVPIEYLRYAILAVAAFVSLLFISKEMMDAGKKYLEPSTIKGITLMWAALHIGFCAMLKLYYFD